MTIVLTGGGSGGHITPILAVAEALKLKDPTLHLVYIGQHGDKLADLPLKHPAIDESFLVMAGKFRRYHGEGFKQLFDVVTMLKNVRDSFKVLFGTVQSYFLLKKLKPALIFTPGGFVGVPVGLAAAKRHIPLVTHDLDAHPGLANRINARWAKIHAVGMPKENYAYNPANTKYVGVPVAGDFQPVSEEQRVVFRQKIGLKREGKLLFVVGGGQGASRINQAILKATPSLLETNTDLSIIISAGRANEEGLNQSFDEILPEGARSQVKVFGYLSDLYQYSGAADLIITRAGASNIAEFATQHKACIVIPNPVLTGGHQLKNVEPLEKAGAVVVLDEARLGSDQQALTGAINDLLENDTRRRALGESLGGFALPDAAGRLAGILLETARAGE